MIPSRVLKSRRSNSKIAMDLLRRSGLMHGSLSELWTTLALNFTVASAYRWLVKACQGTSGVIVAWVRYNRSYRIFLFGSFCLCFGRGTEAEFSLVGNPGPTEGRRGHFNALFLLTNPREHKYAVAGFVHGV